MGRATAIAFARGGAKVILAARREQRGQEVVDQIIAEGGESIFVRTDVRSPKDIENPFKTIMTRYGRLDFAFNNAGVSLPHVPTILKTAEEEWDRLMETNARGVWLCMKEEIPIMIKQGGGVIINTASILGMIGEWGLSHYASSKHASLELAKTAALEYAEENIRINTICPGPIMTEMLEVALPFMPKMLDAMASKTAVRRIGLPEEIAGAALWLCTDDAAFMIGKEIAIDGGYIYLLTYYAQRRYPLNTKSFQDKVVLITGGNSGIGRAAAIAFGREGANVTIAVRREKLGAEVVDEITDKGGAAQFIKTDLAVKEQIDNLFSIIGEQHGRLDCAFNNAGIWPKRKRTINYSIEEFDTVMNINVKAVWRCMRLEVPLMINAGGGAIVNCSSAAGLSTQEDASIYAASKHAVLGLTKAAALEFGRKNIRINAVCPGITQTPMLESELASGSPEKKEALSISPLGRFGKPEEIASTLLFLCSEASSYITAKSLVVAGGQCLRS